MSVEPVPVTAVFSSASTLLGESFLTPICRAEAEEKYLILAFCKKFTFSEVVAHLSVIT